MKTPATEPDQKTACSTFVRMFQPRFARLVVRGDKQQTVRQSPKRMPASGDILDAREWTGKPYRSKQRKLGRFQIVSVARVTIKPAGIEIEGIPIDHDTFAKADGFDDFPAMREWFDETHALPFSGIVICWSNV